MGTNNINVVMKTVAGFRVAGRYTTVETPRSGHFRDVTRAVADVTDTDTCAALPEPDAAMAMAARTAWLRYATAGLPVEDVECELVPWWVDDYGHDVFGAPVASGVWNDTYEGQALALMGHDVAYGVCLGGTRKTLDVTTHVEGLEDAVALIAATEYTATPAVTDAERDAAFDAAVDRLLAD